MGLATTFVQGIAIGQWGKGERASPLPQTSQTPILEFAYIPRPHPSLSPLWVLLHLHCRPHSIFYSTLCVLRAHFSLPSTGVSISLLAFSQPYKMRCDEGASCLWMLSMFSILGSSLLIFQWSKFCKETSICFLQFLKLELKWTKHYLHCPVVFCYLLSSSILSQKISTHL